MKIELNLEIVQEALNQGMERTLYSVVDSPAVRTKLREVLVDEVFASTLRRAASAAIDKLDSDAIGQVLAEKFARAIVYGAGQLIARALAKASMDLSGKRDYQEGYREENESLIAELEARMGLSE